ncbi:hypothetical protein HMPREF0297_1013 [Corynebacterium jeikeium ATCC 43734]|nr:hypothetical protein HMPREF0297_1013 [Corynebacterium jeikeium ATCC 43734]
MEAPSSILYSFSFCRVRSVALGILSHSLIDACVSQTKILSIG